MQIKTYTLHEGDDLQSIVASGADHVLLDFRPSSPNFLTMISTHAGIIPDRGSLSTLTDSCLPQRVGVFVDEMPQNVITRVVNFQLNLIQLHGHETPTYIRNLRRTLDPDISPGIRFIKAISVSSRDDIAANKDYADCVDYFLFDTKCKTVGGSGEQFDWSVLEAYDGDIPFLLSGGIGPDDAERVRNFHHPQCIGIDLNSRFESEPGFKDVAALRQFINQLNRENVK